jgi:hypothetical protein
MDARPFGAICNQLLLLDRNQGSFIKAIQCVQGVYSCPAFLTTASPCPDWVNVHLFLERVLGLKFTESMGSEIQTAATTPVRRLALQDEHIDKTIDDVISL